MNRHLHALRTSRWQFLAEVLNHLYDNATAFSVIRSYGK